MSNTNRKRKASFSSNTSPSKKAKLAEGLLGNPENFDTFTHTLGQITRINLTNWVTFDQTEILCDPGLNLIVGPNGTGKSSIVCAICLGLGGKPRSLGRGDKASDFIKFGRTQAKIQIELFADGRPNDVVNRLITAAGSKWSLNGKKSTAKNIEEFVKNKRNIKVDNLCQFLAQDRVSAFAMLSPKELLIETEKAIENNQLFKWHQFLIAKGDDADNDKKEIENLKQTLQQNIAEKNSLSKSIEQFELKKKMEKQVKNYKALYAWQNVRNKWKLFNRKKKITEKLKIAFEKKKANVGPMKKKQTQLKRKEQTAQNKYTKHLQDVKKIDRRRMLANNKLKTAAKHILDYEDKIQQAVQDFKTRQKTMKKFESEIDKIEGQLQDFNEDEIVEAQTQRQKITRTDLKKLRIERGQVDKDLRAAQQKKTNAAHNLTQVSKEVEQMKNISSRQDQHIFNSHRRKDKQFKAWVDTHAHEFRGQVFGPIVKEMTVRNDLHAKFLNNSIGLSAFYGYVCQKEDDWRKLLRKSQDMNLQITIYTAADENKNDDEYIRRPVVHDTLRANGVDGYLDEIFDAPDIIKKTLNNVLGLSIRAYAMHEVDFRSLDNVLVVHKGQSGRLRRLITPGYVYSVKESHYTNQVMRSQDALRDFGSRGVLRVTPDYSQRIYQKEEEQKEWHQQLDNIEQEKQQIEQKRKKLHMDIQKLQDAKAALEKTINQFNRLKNKLAKKEKDLQELQDEQDDPEEIKENFTKIIQKKNNDRVKIFDQLAKDIALETDMMKLSIGFELSKKYFHEEVEFVRKQIVQISCKNKELRKAFDKSKREEERITIEYEREIQHACYNWPRADYQDEWTEEDRKLPMESIQSKISSFQGRINVLMIDDNKVERYNRLLEKIEGQQKKLEDKQDAQASKHDLIKDIENKWKPKLLEAVEKISSKFSEFFAQFNKAQGKVELVFEDLDTHEELKYSEWCIDILTKFRPEPSVPWKRLTSSSQSGGEKSVSTMLYLLSLQQVTTVPFRVVDEINQGMDPINERRIMKILNYECTPKTHRGNSNNNNNERHLPQYFVVTPKLLPRLQYSPCSSVYVIFNGPWQMAHKQWQMDKFIQSQKELTGRANTNNNNNNNNNNNDESDDDDDDDDEDDEESDEESDDEDEED